MICVDPENYIPLSGTHLSHPYFPSSLLLTCQQLYHEVRPIYFTKNKFSIKLERRNESLSYFLLPSFADNLRSINTICLTITRWGAKDYFLTTLAPVIEDLILRGSLRNLEVNARESDIVRYDPARDVFGLNIGSDVVRELVKICEDPYLDTISLRTYARRKQEFESEPDEFGSLESHDDVTHLLNKKSAIR
jgi:hypothetical protein